MDNIENSAGLENEEIISKDLEDNKSDKKIRFFSKIAYFFLLAAVFLLPVFFIPFQSAHFLFTKQFIFVSAVMFGFGVWLFTRLKSGTYEWPNTLLLIAGGGVVLATFLSVLFSGSFSSAFIGQGFEVGTFVSVFAGFLAVFLIPLYFTSKEKIFSAYTAIFVAFAVIVLFEVARLIKGPGFLSFGILTDITSNTVGKWNDLGVFFGMVSILTLVTLEFFRLGRIIKILSYATLAASLFFLALINFSAVWTILGVFSVVLFVYLFSFGKEHRLEQGENNEEGLLRRRFPFATVFVVIISLLFIIFGSYASSYLSSKFNITQLEVRPSWQSTLSVAKETLSHDPIFGAGPNQFVGEWLKYKDPTINATMFWNTDFGYGIGLIPTFIVTTGLLGMIAWIIFLAIFIYSGFRAVFAPTSDKTLRYLTISSFSVALFLWIFNIIYSPGNVMFAFSFIFTGLFVASLIKENVVKVKSGLYTENSKISFLAVLSLILLIIVTISIEYFIVQRYISQYYFQRGIIILNTTGNIDQSEAKFLKAASLSKNDLFYRTLSEIGIVKMSNLVASATKDSPIEALRNQFQSILASTINYSEEALKIDNENYLNWVSRGRIYEAVVPLNIEGAYEAAKVTYDNALKYNPHNPSIYLMLARLEFAKENNKKAREYINKSLTEKQNYTDAIYFLSQIEVKEGNIKAAIKSVEGASVLTPNDPAVFFQLGLLKFNNKDYRGAETAFNQALALSPLYANAKYFLGLSYEKLGKNKEAISQFTDLKQTNPDNSEVDLILQNLKAGRAPFSDAKSPIDDKPEKRTKPPVED